MLVRQFLHYIKSAPLDARVEAVAEFARLVIDNAIADAERQQADAALVLMLDDPALAVRRAMAQVLGPSTQAPYPVISGLMNDEPHVAAIVARHSPLLFEADLQDLIKTNDPILQIAIADRSQLSMNVVDTLAEAAGLEACLALLDNEKAPLNAKNLNRILDRHGEDSDIREALIKRPDLPVSTQQALIVKMSETLSGTEKSPQRTDKSARDACDRATLALAARLSGTAPQELVRHLIESGQMTASFLLRVILTGNMALFETSLAELTGFTSKRVASLVHDRRGAGFKALYEAAGLPHSAFPAFAAAIHGWHEDGMGDLEASDARLKRRMIERALTACTKQTAEDHEQLFSLLRRFEAETLRDEARHLAQDIDVPQLTYSPSIVPEMDVEAMTGPEEAWPEYTFEAEATPAEIWPEVEEAQQIAEIEASAARIQADLQQLITERAKRYALAPRRQDVRWTMPDNDAPQFFMPKLGAGLTSRPSPANPFREPRATRYAAPEGVYRVDPARLFVA